MLVHKLIKKVVQTLCERKLLYILHFRMKFSFTPLTCHTDPRDFIIIIIVVTHHHPHPLPRLLLWGFFQCKIQSLYKNMELYSAFCYSGVLLQTCPDVRRSETGVRRSKTGVRRSETVGCAV